MSSRHSVLIAGAPFEIGAVYADCFARRGSDAVPVALGRTRRRAPFQRIFRLTAQATALLEGGTSHSCLRADPGRSVHLVSFEASLIP
jgi:NAD(P)-dependent dehydrogenase (short-subunit alcohol dehydrogenase family)